MKIRGQTPDADDAAQGNKPVSYVCDKKEAKGFCDSLYGMSFPYGYAANMKMIVSRTENKLMSMKSHDSLYFDDTDAPCRDKEYLDTKGSTNYKEFV